MNPRTQRGIMHPALSLTTIASRLAPTVGLRFGFANDIPRMQPAFLLRRFFPPPAAFALVLVRQYRAGAGFAADADEAAFVQAVVPVSYTHLTLPTILRV